MWTAPRALMLAAQAAGVERIVYCSSVAALGLTKDGSEADETTKVSEETVVGIYKKSKYRAEQAVLALVREQGLPAVIVNPAAPVGPRDVKPTPTGKMIADAASGKMFAYLDTGLSIVHVDDVAQGHLLALDRGRIGERYILGGENMSLRPASGHGHRPGRPQAAMAEAVARGALAAGDGLRGDGDGHRHHPAGHPRPSAHVAQADVFLLRQGHRRTRLRPPPRQRGRGRRHRLVPRQRDGAGMTVLAAIALLAWLYLVFLHGRFWRDGERLAPMRPAHAPDLAVVVPARDEADMIAPVIASLLAQDYPGQLRVVLVDDNSTDGTGDIARALPGAEGRLTVLTGEPRPPGWAGKLWAVHQGVAATTEPFILLTDADITHDPAHVATLVAQAQRMGADMVSEMVELNCESFAERALIPAFVYLFALLYPFARSNNPRRRTAAAAGGTVLIRRRALERIGGIEAIGGALIDDVTLAGKVKQGGRIWLGHSRLARSIRPYPGFADVWRMVARSAYVQLRYSPLLLAADHARPRPRVPGAPARRPARPFQDRPGRLGADGRQLPAHTPPLPPLAALGTGPAADRRLLYGGNDRGGGGSPSGAGRGLEKPGLYGE